MIIYRSKVYEILCSFSLLIVLIFILILAFPYTDFNLTLSYSKGFKYNQLSSNCLTYALANSDIHYSTDVKGYCTSEFDR